jgi:hypothetical protein
LLIRQGSEFVVVIDITNIPSTGNYPFLQAWTITEVEMHIRQPLGSATLLVDPPWTLSNKISQSGSGATRQIVIAVPYTDLEDITLIPAGPISGNQNPQAERTAGTAVHDVEMTISDGAEPTPALKRIRLVEGNISVSRQVTRQS